MYRLLIVDDEPIIVDGIYRLLQEEEGLELDLYRAYSGDEALEKLSWMRFDIVLSDIRMPGMSGLELQGHITDRWPACKVIFLTGHPDFEYVQAALRGKSIDYILKTESDEEVVASVRKAMGALRAESQNARFLDKAAEQLQLAIPTLQKDYLQGLCEGTKTISSLKPELLKELHIPLQLQEPLLLVIGRVDRWPESISKASDKALMMFAIHNIAKEYFMPCSIQAVNTDYNRFIWLLQPEASAVSPLPAADPSWIRTIRFVHGTLERIQAASLQLLKLPISVAAGKSAVEWKDLSSCYDKLRKGLSRGLGIGQGTMIIEDQQPEESAQENEMQKQTIRHLVKKLTASDFHFENVDKEEFMKLILDISVRLEPFYEETDFFLSYITPLRPTCFRK
ncbi:response regulator [Paenibacillus sp. CC-CFT747]|nr:response regulator [Paenibacillus sp. CC-CFT747]